MKKITLLTLLMAVTLSIFSQIKIAHYKWSDPTSFKLSPSPKITGYGYYSDSLAKLFDGKTFYVHNGEYYLIESWADYYYWFVKEYWFKFQDPQLYEYYYWGADDYGMASYIASNKYLGKYYPSSVFVDFGDKPLLNNRLAESEYLVTNDEEIEALKRELESDKKELKTDKKEKDITKDNSIKKEAPEIFKKEEFRKKEYIKEDFIKNESTNTNKEFKDQSSSKKRNEIK